MRRYFLPPTTPHRAPHPPRNVSQIIYPGHPFSTSTVIPSNRRKFPSSTGTTRIKVTFKSNRRRSSDADDHSKKTFLRIDGLHLFSSSSFECYFDSKLSMSFASVFLSALPFNSYVFVFCFQGCGGGPIARHLLRVLQAAGGGGWRRPDARGPGCSLWSFRNGGRFKCARLFAAEQVSTRIRFFF